MILNLRILENVWIVVWFREREREGSGKVNYEWGLAKVDLMGEVAVRLGGKVPIHLSWDNTQWFNIFEKPTSTNNVPSPIASFTN